MLGKRYTVYDVLACVFMTIGLIFFTLADAQVQPEFDPLGKTSRKESACVHWDVQGSGLSVVRWLRMLWLAMYKRKHWKNTNRAILRWWEIGSDVSIRKPLLNLDSLLVFDWCRLSVDIRSLFWVIERGIQAMVDGSFDQSHKCMCILFVSLVPDPILCPHHHLFVRRLPWCQLRP